MKRSLFIAISALACLQFVKAQPGAIDLAFGTKGEIVADPGFRSDYSVIPKKVLVAADDNFFIILSSEKITHVIKKTAKGSIDSSYGINGSSAALDLFDPVGAIQPDGKIIVAGTSAVSDYEERFPHGYDFTVIRLNKDGSVDKSFSQDGKVTSDFKEADDYATAVAVLDNGKIIVGGIATAYYYEEFQFNVYNIALAKYNSNGTIDSSFGDNGKAWAPDENAAPDNDQVFLNIDADGRILTTRNNFDRGLIVKRFNEDGSYDDTYQTDINLLSNDSSFVCSDAILQTDGKLLIAGLWTGGSSPWDFDILRFDEDGLPDLTFGNLGWVRTDFSGNDDGISALALQEDNKIVASGYTLNNGRYAFATARYNHNGTLDISFGINGKITTIIDTNNIISNACAITNAGKIIVAGVNSSSRKKLVIAAYNIDGSADNSFAVNGSLIQKFEIGKTAYTAAVKQADGKLIAAGYTYNGNNYDFLISRFNTDGTIDRSFSEDGHQVVGFSDRNDYAYDVAIQSDGKIIIAGTSETYREDFLAVVVLHPDGTSDNTFNGTGKKIIDIENYSTKPQLVLQNDAKILISTYSTLLRLNVNGTPDNTFNTTGRLNPGIVMRDLALQSTGKIIIAGAYESYFALERYNSNGSLDLTFATDGLQTTDFFPEIINDDVFNYYYASANSVIIQQDDKIVLGGEAGRVTRYTTETNVGLARFDKDGNPDLTFSEDGRHIVNFNTFKNDKAFYALQSNVVLQNDNKIIVSSNLVAYDESLPAAAQEIPLGYAMARLRTDGNIDADFGKQGYVGIINNNNIQELLIAKHKLFTVGSRDDVGEVGLITNYKLGNILPLVSITKPANQQVFSAPANILMEAEASDPDGRIIKVEFYNGNILLGKEYKTPYTFAWKNVQLGNYTITAKAFDNWGAVSSTSVNISVEPNKAPEVTITSPTEKATFIFGATIPITAEAKDIDGRVTKVEFFDGTLLIRTEYKYPYTYQWQNASGGMHTITAVATDNYGKKGTSSSITVIVDQPLISINVKKPDLDAEQQNIQSVVLNPNPAKSILNISGLLGKNNKTVTVLILSLSGEKVKEIRLPAAANRIQLNVSTLQSGTYTVQIKNGNTVITKQFIKL